MERASRLLKLLQLLDTRSGRTRQELCRELGVSERSMYRDLASLEEHGMLLEQNDGRYRLAGSQRSVVLSEQERLALQLLLSAPALRHDEVLRRQLDALAMKLRPAIDGVSSSLTLADLERSGRLADGLMRVIDDAIAKQQTLRIDYASLSRKGRHVRRVDPYVVFHRGEAWYLAAYCHENRAPRMFRLDRIAAAASTGDLFLRPDGFDVRTWLADAWSLWTGEETHEVIVHFARDVAPLIEHAVHHPDEVKVRRIDGTLEYRVTLGHLEEIARWIAGFGGKARAVAPPALVQRLREIGDEVARVHREAKPSRDRTTAAKTVRIKEKR